MAASLDAPMLGVCSNNTAARFDSLRLSVHNRPCSGIRMVVGAEKLNTASA